MFDYEKKDFSLGDIATVVTDGGERISGEIISYATYGPLKRYRFVGIKTSPKEVKEFPLESIIQIIPKRYGHSPKKWLN